MHSGPSSAFRAAYPFGYVQRVPRLVSPSQRWSSHLATRAPLRGWTQSGRHGDTYPDMTWEPKAAFTAIADCYRG
jgi:hypothetical protein